MNDTKEIRYYKGRYRVEVLGKKQHPLKWNWLVKALDPFILSYGGICSWEVKIGEVVEVFPYTLRKLRNKERSHDEMP